MLCCAIIISSVLFKSFGQITWVNGCTLLLKKLKKQNLCIETLKDFRILVQHYLAIVISIFVL